MWLKIIRQNISQLARRAKGSASIEQKNGNGNKASKTNNNGADVNRNEEQNGSLDKSQAKKKPVVPGGTPLLQQTEISNSQLDFFRMLDEKIESGPDYDESSDATLRAEHVASLLRRWELASVTWSSVDIDNSNDSSPTPTIKSSSTATTTTTAQSNRLGSLQQQHHQRASAACAYLHQQKTHQPMSVPPPVNYSTCSKDRNAAGGRPETPVYVQRISSANRLDGLQDIVGHHPYHHPYHQLQQQQQQQHSPSPSMPRHVLESISQSPTQSLKNPPGVLQQQQQQQQQHVHYPHYHHQEQSFKTQTKTNNNTLNGESYGHAPPSYYQQQQQPTHRGREPQQPYDSPVMLMNSPSNPYLGKFQISSSVSPLASPIPASTQQYGTGTTGGNTTTTSSSSSSSTSNSRRRTGAGGYGTAQMT